MCKSIYRKVPFPLGGSVNRGFTAVIERPLDPSWTWRDALRHVSLQQRTHHVMIARENLADSDPVIIPYKVVHKRLRAIVLRAIVLVLISL